MFYSPSMKGFLNDNVSQGEMPADAFELPDAEYRRLIDGAKGDTEIVFDRDSGTLSLATVHVDSDERAWRDTELASVMWLRERHRDQQEIGHPTTLSAEQFVELLTYMQALRDWPQAGHFPAIEHRPVPPYWMAEYAQ